MKRIENRRISNRNSFVSSPKLTFSNIELPAVDAPCKNQSFNKSFNRLNQNSQIKDVPNQQAEASFFKGGSLRPQKIESYPLKKLREIEKQGEKDLDSFLHRSEVSINVADQIRKLNQHILDNEFNNTANHTNSSFANSLAQQQQNGLPNLGFQSHSRVGSSINNNSQFLQSVSSISNRGHRQSLSNFNTRNYLEGEEQMKRKREEQKNMRSASNFFGMTQQSNSTNLPSQYQQNLLKALNMCDQQQLDKIAFAKKNERSSIQQSQEMHPIHSLKENNSKDKIMTQISTGGFGSKRQPFKIKEITDSSSFKSSQYSSANLDWKQFYSHFDTAKKDISNYMHQNEGLSQLQAKQVAFEIHTKPIFLQKTVQKRKSVINMKQIMRLQTLRENKIIEEEEKNQDQFDILKIKNQIESVKQSSNKIKNLKVVADLIDQEIGGQNGKIDLIVSNLIQKFELDKYEEKPEFDNHL